MNYDPNLDPEAVVLSKVYALLIQAARQKKAKEQLSDSGAKMGHQGPVNLNSPNTTASIPAE